MNIQRAVRPGGGEGSGLKVNFEQGAGPGNGVEAPSS